MEDYTPTPSNSNPPQDTIEIPLTQGKVAIINAVDADLADLKWHARKSRNTFYARRNIPVEPNKQTTESMHRVILARKLERPLRKSELVDHIDGDGLNNRRNNLRPATNAQNVRNSRKRTTNTSGFKGVSWNKEHRKWRAEIMARGKKKFLGLFNTAEEAHKAYCEAAEQLHGEFANFGSIEGDEE